MEQVIDVAGKWADQFNLLEAFHANGALRSSGAFNNAHIVDLLEAALVALVLAPVVRIALLEAVLHIGVHLSAIHAKVELLKILQDLLVRIIDYVFGVAIEELLLVPPQRLWSEADLSAETPTNGPDENAACEHKEHDHLNPTEEECNHHGGAEPGQLARARVPVNERDVVAVNQPGDTGQVLGKLAAVVDLPHQALLPVDVHAHD